MEFASGESKTHKSKKQNSPKGYRWCRTNNGINCDGNVYSVQVMQQTMSYGPKTFLQAFKESGKTLQSFYDENNDKYKFGPNTGGYQDESISGLYIDRVDGNTNTIYFYQQLKNGKRQDLNPINMNDIILKTSGGRKRRRNSLFKKKRTKKRRIKRRTKRKRRKRKRKTRRRRK